jgi:hypothetical protein
MPPFNAKEVCRFFFWIAVLLLVVTILFLLIWRSPGTERIQLQPPGAAVFPLDMRTLLVAQAITAEAFPTKLRLTKDQTTADNL